MNANAEAIAYALRRIPGSRAEVDYFRIADGAVVEWLYACPCGEFSVYSVCVADGDPVSTDFVIESAKEAMRRHVRSEGNEPSF